MLIINTFTVCWNNTNYTVVIHVRWDPDFRLVQGVLFSLHWLIQTSTIESIYVNHIDFARGAAAD